jgi:integrase
MTQLTYTEKLKATKCISEFKGNFRVQFKLPDIKSAVRRSLGIMACEENLETAKESLNAIKRDIINGSYRVDPDHFWATHFPNSVKIKSVKMYTVSSIFDIYEEEKYDDLTESLKSKFKSCKTWTAKYKILDLDIRELTHKHLNKARQASAKTLAVSTVIEYSQTLRKIMELAVDDDLLDYNPFVNVSKLVPDERLDESILTFTKKELTSLLNVVHVPQTKSMIEFLVWTGLRPGEMKALAWEDVFIDEHKQTGYLKINCNLDRKGNLKKPKTRAGTRKVELLPTTVKLLTSQKEQSFHLPTINEVMHLKHRKTKVISRRRVFLSRDNKPFKRPELTNAPKQWANWLKEAGLAHRPPYQLRHTYASRMLKAGANHLWLTKQMGHADWGMIRIIYGKWIDEGSDEVKKIVSNLDIEHGIV